MCLHHIFYRVGNNVARGQRVQHAVVTHGYAIVNGYGVELCSIATKFFNLLLYELPGLVQMGVAWYKLGERVGYGNNGLAKMLTLHACSYPQGTCARHSSSFGAECTAQLYFHNSSRIFISFVA